jgi:type VI secretion system secreted protein VgrG
MIGQRTIEIIAPAAAGPLLFESMNGREALGTPFEFHVELSSASGDVPIASLLGKPFSIELNRGMSPPRWFNGMIARFAFEGWTGDHFQYRADLRPLLWLLTRTSNCRIFQGQTIPDVIMGIFKAQGIPAKKQLGRESYAQWEYLVQYNETDFNFVSRLMEQEGISYYFTHESGNHTMVLVDALTVHDTTPGYETITFSTTGDRIAETIGDNEYISRWGQALEIEPGAFAAKDYDFEKPRAPLLSVTTSPNPHDHAGGQIFQYPGVYIDTAERDEYTKRRLEESQLEYQQVQGGGNSSGITPGFRFALTDHPASSQNLAVLVTAATYNLTSNQHTASATGDGPDFLCSFTAIDSKRPFRTPVSTPKPHVPGPQTATVVGTKGEEIWTDKYGRVKVQFHWDRVGAKDEKSSCWVRVSQAWAGANWGAMHIPRIGQEVIVDFLEGDPDRPIITGRVYNADNMPPYDLPANQTQSGIKSRSTKGGGPANFNELRFEDKKGAEQVYLHAEKDQLIEVENDETHEVGHDRKKDIKHDETTTVGNNRTESVTKDETISIGGNRTETVTKNETITITGNRTESVTGNETIAITGNRTETVTKNETVSITGARTLSVTKNDDTTVTGAQSVSVTKDQTVTVSGGRTLSITKDDGVSVDGKRSVSIGKDDVLDVGKKLTITVADEILIKTGDASISMKKDGTIIIKGKDITVDGSGKINVKAGGDIVLKGSKVSQN